MVVMEDTPASSGQPSDRALVASMRDPGSDALVVLLRRHADALYEYVAAVVDAPAAAEDAFMRVFVRAWSQLTVRRMPGESALPWMLAAARDAAFEITGVHRDPPASVLGGDALSSDEDPGALSSALRRLSAPEHRIVELTLAEGLSYRHAVRRARPRGERGLHALLRPWGRSRGAGALLRGDANG
jgi:DNA-directed RNA polymerase specialized sigma24 family protein